MNWQLVLPAVIFLIPAGQVFGQKLPRWIFKTPTCDTSVEMFVATGNGFDLKNAYLDAVQDLEIRLGQLSGRKISLVAGQKMEIIDMRLQFANALEYKILCQYPVLQQNFFGQVYLLVAVQKDIHTEPVYPICNCGTEKTQRSRTIEFLQKEMFRQKQVIEKMNEELAKNQRIKKSHLKTLDSVNLEKKSLMSKIQNLENQIEIHNQSALLYTLTDSLLFLDSQLDRRVDIKKYVSNTGQLHKSLIKYFQKNSQDEIVKVCLIHYYDGLEAIYLKYGHRDKLLKINELKTKIKTYKP